MHEPRAPRRRPPTASEVSGPTTAIKNSWRGVRASPSIAVTPPRKCRVIERDREAVVPGHERVRRLVQQHREVEQDREREPGDVLPAAEARAATCSTRGAIDDRDQRRDEEPRAGDEHVAAGDRARSGTCPAGAAAHRAAGVAALGSRLDTCRGYPTAVRRRRRRRTVGAARLGSRA